MAKILCKPRSLVPPPRRRFSLASRFVVVAGVCARLVSPRPPLPPRAVAPPLSRFYHYPNSHFAAKTSLQSNNQTTHQLLNQHSELLEFHAVFPRPTALHWMTAPLQWRVHCQNSSTVYRRSKKMWSTWGGVTPLLSSKSEYLLPFLPPIILCYPPIQYTRDVHA